MVWLRVALGVGILCALTACKKETKNSAASQGTSETSVASPGAKSLTDEAAEMALAFFRSHWQQCGDSYLSVVSVPARDDRFEEIKGLRPYMPKNHNAPLTEADRLNGLSWKGVFCFDYVAFRSYNRQTKQWSEWQAPGRAMMGRAGYWQLQVTNRDGKWEAKPWMDGSEYGGDEIEFHHPIDCEKAPAHTSVAGSPERQPNPFVLQSVRKTTVASLVPAATSLIVGMGAGDHLVAVSNYDPAKIGDRKVPRVGDYQAVDWETLSLLKPDVMIIQVEPDHSSVGFAQKAESIGIRVVNVQLNTLADVLEGIRVLGRESGDAEKGEALSKQLSFRIEALRKQSASLPVVKTLLTLDPEGKSLVGPSNFLDDLLTAAGGANAAASLGAPYPSADGEMLLRLAPSAVILLSSDASPQMLERAKRFWHGIEGVPAGKDERVFLIKYSGVLLPDEHLVDLAEEIFRNLHGSAHATTRSASP